MAVNNPSRLPINPSASYATKQAAVSALRRPMGGYSGTMAGVAAGVNSVYPGVGNALTSMGNPFTAADTLAQTLQHPTTPLSGDFAHRAGQFVGDVARGYIGQRYVAPIGALGHLGPDIASFARGAAGASDPATAVAPAASPIATTSTAPAAPAAAPPVAPAQGVRRLAPGVQRFNIGGGADVPQVQMYATRGKDGSMTFSSTPGYAESVGSGQQIRLNNDIAPPTESAQSYGRGLSPAEATNGLYQYNAADPMAHETYAAPTAMPGAPNLDGTDKYGNPVDALNTMSPQTAARAGGLYQAYSHDPYITPEEQLADHMQANRYTSATQGLGLRRVVFGSPGAAAAAPSGAAPAGLAGAAASTLAEAPTMPIPVTAAQKAAAYANLQKAQAATTTATAATTRATAEKERADTQEYAQLDKEVTPYMDDLDDPQKRGDAANALIAHIPPRAMASAAGFAAFSTTKTGQYINQRLNDIANAGAVAGESWDNRIPFFGSDEYMRANGGLATAQFDKNGQFTGIGANNTADPKDQEATPNVSSLNTTIFGNGVGVANTPFNQYLKYAAAAARGKLKAYYAAEGVK